MARMLMKSGLLVIIWGNFQGNSLEIVILLGRETLKIRQPYLMNS
jgi:hypothetical protein